MHVVATAGHVDYGKSTLVRALTGMEPDRWEEERRRGLTIDLGYAWTTLPSGQDVAFVDVPGHERFLGNMLAGIGPAPVVCFVVAADEGWQAQSSDHRDAVAALGIEHGVVVLSRADRASGRRIADVLARTRTRAGRDRSAERARSCRVRHRRHRPGRIACRARRRTGRRARTRHHGAGPVVGGPLVHHHRFRNGGDRNTGSRNARPG